MYKKTSLARSLALAFGSAVLMLSMPAPVLAQSNTAGSIYGTVSAAPGTVIQLENKATGAKRSVPGDANGRFNFASVPPGSYRLQLLRDGKVVETRDDIELSASQNQEISFANAGTTLEAVLVTGTRKVIDVTKTSSSTSFSAEKLAALPVAKNVTAVVLLAPNTTAADSRYSGGSSFAGGAASENASYINGFPVTNPLTQLGASELPFGAIQELQVLTGGMGAEFGRSVGGVVNIITKSGSNRWEGGVMMSVEPAGLRGKSVNLDYPTTGAAVNATTDGKLRRFRADDSLSKTEVGAYVGGPLIKDKLFLFIAAQQNDNKFSRVRLNNLSTDNASVLKWGWTEDKDRSQRLFSKLDWNLSDEHRLELSAIRDNSTRDSSYSGYDYSTLSRVAGSPITLNYKNIAGETPDGGDVNILKYTGYLTPDLTVTALVGESRVKHSNGIAGADIYDPSKALFGVQFPAGTQAPGLNYFNPNPLVGSLMSGKDARDTIKSKRIDIEYQLGRHSLRAGIDDNKLASKAAGDFTAGGGTWAFRKAPNPSAVRLAGKTFDLQTGGAAPTVLQKQGFYVLRSLFDDLTDAYSDQSALYLEDRWQVNKQLLLTAGIRKEDYNNRNHFNEKFVDQKNQIAPRLAAAFDVNGDGSLKLFGSAGRYFIQIPTHLAVRGASPSTGTSQIFGYTGIDPTTGAPTGLNQVSEPRSANNELGQRKDVRQITATNLKPTYQDEIVLGFEKALQKDLAFGARLTYRKLRSTIDDYCDQTPIDAWAVANGVDNSHYPGFNCASINPGEKVDLDVDFAGDGKKYHRVSLTPEEMGLPKAKRSYVALDLFLEHALRNGWYGKVNYTWSRNYGNTEGQTLSDVAQTDVAATQTWDNGDVMIGAYGPLANHRTHQLKAYGFFQFNDEWTVGGAAILASGRPISCLNNFTTAPGQGAGSPSYRFHYCDGQISPRGAIGNLPMEQRLDLNLSYQPRALKGLGLKIDVFNVLNRQQAITVREDRNVPNSVAVDAVANGTLATAAARAVKLTVSYDVKF